MNKKDYVRRLTEAGHVPERRRSWSRLIHLDPLLLLILAVISAFGLMVLHSAVGEQDFKSLTGQASRFLLAAVVMLGLAQLSPVFYQRWALWAYLVALVLLVAVLMFGTVVNGSRRWLRIPGLFGFQPSELMKILVPMTLAWYFHDRHLPPRLVHVLWSLMIILLPVILIARQPDLGTAILIGASGLLVLLLAGLSWVYVVGFIALCVLIAPVGWMLMHDYQRERILTLFDPERDPLGSGWNIIQSKTAIGSGGLFGKGLFAGTQSQLEFLPERQTDFIVAVLGEELGLVGIAFLLFLYVLVIGRGLVIAIGAQETFGRLLAGTISFTFFVYVFVNIGMVIGLLPIVGVPLPLVSFGGTSVLSLFAGFGILMSIHTHRRITL